MSSVPNYTVVPITKDDIPTIGTFLQDSKLQLAINRFLIKDWPNEPVQKALYTGAIEGGVKSTQTTSLKVMSDASGLPVAHLFYTKTKSRTSASDEPTTGGTEGRNDNKVPAGVIPEVYWTVIDAVEELKPDFNTEEYMELTHIYVEPSSRGQGIGSWLVRIAQEDATAAGLPFSICAEPNHHGFFLNRGFKDVKKFDVELTKWAAPLSGYGTFRISRMVMEK
ncbi:hypothetical protein F5Y19DRAFT_483928 [Xylariaceae sp. FL1651]|nr:hypothetical protein F5Y19DRAFT_483928 [Xylariaceae sp. FL1651]